MNTKEKKQPLGQIKFTDNLKNCIGKDNRQGKFVEIFLVNGIKLEGNVTYVSESMVSLSNKKKGNSTINTIHIASYVIEPPKPLHREVNGNRRTSKYDSDYRY